MSSTPTISAGQVAFAGVARPVAVPAGTAFADHAAAGVRSARIRGFERRLPSMFDGKPYGDGTVDLWTTPTRRPLEASP